MTTATDTCVELADAIHRSSVKTAEKKSKSVAKLWRAEADFAFFSQMTVCVLLSANENKGRSEEAAWEHAFNFYKDATVRFQDELKEVKEEQKN
ncbi:hypothetical protein N7481_006266 [Penicillium waksmanii]|uniref:uncharacterized protein n=1 Tax=Penicillium waksmanii TaxID=69791 RepID=UPI0025498290|nr:uncharacterized protein N7481_006266 [Penicillium waksmanii]KAJ5984167.1 hypothetical protein N7481_006266 [Penicillium waksmanii]